MNTIRFLALAVCFAALMAGCATVGDSTTSDKVLTDAQIASDVMTRLNDDNVMGQARPVNVEVQNGVVTLRGVLRDDAKRARAESIARGTPGVNDVVNLIEDR